MTSENGGTPAGTGGDSTNRVSFLEEAIPHMDAVYRFALRLTGTQDGAEDLVQDTFFRAYRAWDQYTPGTRCKSWLFTICRNVFLRQRERQQRHDEIVQETAHEDAASLSREAPVFAASKHSDPEGDFFKSIVDEEILQAIDDLPHEYRMAVVLSDLEDLSYNEIAEIMEIPVGTVKSRLFRGRRQLQKRLHGYAVEMGYISGTSGDQ
ncbi:MAG: sigma-70 family RNA polymerase sigma factor [Gemmatimonadota bacterium]|nr:MAG: sigma-70 family RNA polymerase sigma factor [Gemmatimonadota bacterium]